MLLSSRNLESETTLNYEVVVVGTGAGGAVVGKELAEMGISVLFLEEGDAHPPETHRDLASQALARLYRNRALTFALGNSTIAVPYGKSVGGTTVINSGTCFRTPKKVHDQWVQQNGLHEISEEALTPHYERVEKNINSHQEPFELMSKANQMIHFMGEREGLTGRPLHRNSLNCGGCGMCCYGCTSGSKQSTDISYIPKALAAGADLLPLCKVTKILRKEKKITGVEGAFVDRNGFETGKKIKINSKITIVAAGAIQTPHVLKTCGVKMSKHLGRNLTLHPAVKVYAEFDEDIMGWEGISQAYTLDVFKDQGLLFEGVFIPPDVGAAMNPLMGKRLHDMMWNYKKLLTYGFMISDSGTGQVRDLPFLGPSIFYSFTPNDVRRIQMGLAFLCRLLLKNGAKKVYPTIHSKICEMKTLSDVEAFEKKKLKPREIDAAGFHPLGTARMGKSPAHGVVDVWNKVFGTEGLYVSDGSVLPSSLKVNPQVTIMAFADRLAKHLCETQISGISF